MEVEDGCVVQLHNPILMIRASVDSSDGHTLTFLGGQLLCDFYLRYGCQPLLGGHQIIVTDVSKAAYNF